MSGAWKGAHIRPDFGDDGLYRNPAPNARNLSSNCSIHSQRQQQETAVQFQQASENRPPLPAHTMHRTGAPP